MAAVSLFWDTNMAAVTSCENTLLGKPIDLFSRLTQCCTQFKSPGVKILCVLYLHYNVAVTFKWYGNSQVCWMTRPPLSQGLDLALCLPLSAFAALFTTFFSLIWAVIFWSAQFGCSFYWLYFDKFRDTAPLVAGTKRTSQVTSHAGESTGHPATVNDKRHPKSFS